MKTRIKKHIDEKNFVKVYLSDNNGFTLTNFDGIIFEQNEKFVLMSDFYDFKYDSFIVIRKSDISEIKWAENEIFYDSILEREGLKDELFQKAIDLNFKLGGLYEMFSILKEKGNAVIIERLYEKVEKFQIGPINKVEKKRVFIDYFNARGEYDLKPVTSKFKEITFFRIDSHYANTFFKYAQRIT